MTVSLMSALVSHRRLLVGGSQVKQRNLDIETKKSRAAGNVRDELIKGDKPAPGPDAALLPASGTSP